MSKPLVVALALCACGCARSEGPPPAPPAPFRASCQTPTLGVCTEYTEAAFVLGEELVKTGCLELKGTWTPARCPPQHTLGSCALDGQRRLYYPGGDLDFSPDRARRDCVELFSGEWFARR